MPQSRVRFIGSRELHRDLPKVLENLENPSARCVLTIHSKPKAVLIGAEAFLSILRDRARKIGSWRCSSVLWFRGSNPRQAPIRSRARSGKRPWSASDRRARLLPAGDKTNLMSECLEILDQGHALCLRSACRRMCDRRCPGPAGSCRRPCGARSQISRRLASGVRTVTLKPTLTPVVILDGAPKAPGEHAGTIA